MYYLTCGTLKWKIQCSSHSLERCVRRCYQKIFNISILYICTINGCQNYLVCSKRIETLISECLCIFIGRIQVIFIGLWPGTQSRIGTFCSLFFFQSGSDRKDVRSSRRCGNVCKRPCLRSCGKRCLRAVGKPAAFPSGRKYLFATGGAAVFHISIV